NARALAILAVGAGQGIEGPLAQAASADEAAIGVRCDDGEIRLPRANGAVSLTPVREFLSRQECVRRAEEKRPEREDEHLVGVRRVSGVGSTVLGVRRA